MTTLKPLNVTPPEGSAWAASLAEPKHKVSIIRNEPQPETPETIRVVVHQSAGYKA